MLASRLCRLKRLPTNYPSTRSLSSFYDIVIVGGGLVGNAMACSIGLNEKLKSQSVLVLDTGKPSSLPSSAAVYSNRVSAVSPASARLFEELGVWSRLRQHRVTPVSGLYVIDSCSASHISFEQPREGSPIAYIVENGAIIAVLYDRIRESCSNVTIQNEAKVESYSVPKSLAENGIVTLADGTTIEASLVIGADGARSLIRQTMGVQYTAWEYEQKGIVATLEVAAGSENSIAWQRFTPLGPLALLPLTRDQSSLVWTTSASEAQRLLALAPDQFVDELNHYLFTEEHQSPLTNQALSAWNLALSALTWRSGSEEKRLSTPSVIKLVEDNRAAFPLGFGYAKDYVKTRTALIGDAAHRVHPLAGQGVNLGWHDVKAMSNCLESAIHEGGDIGSLVYLGEYDKSCQRHNAPVAIAVDWLNRLYNTDFGPLVFLRSMGLQTVDRLGPVKDLIIHRASH